MRFGEVIAFLVYIVQVVAFEYRRCSFEIADLNVKRTEFLQMLDDEIKVVYFDLDLSTDTVNEMDNPSQNALLRWIWSKEDVAFLLTYPDDFPALTFNLLDGVTSKHLYLNLTLKDDYYNYCNYSYFINQLLHKNFFENQTDWLMCHRTLEIQEWKSNIDFVLNYWIGYDFECYISDGYPQYTALITRSPINHVIIIFLVIIGLYSPLFFLFFPERIETCKVEKRLTNYQPGDSPYSVSRLFLQTSKEFECGFFNSTNNEDSFVPEFRLLLSLFIILSLMQFIQKALVRYFIVDYELFKSTYGSIGEVYTPFFSREAWGISLALIIIIFVSFKLARFMNKSLRMSNIYFIPVIWCRGFGSSNVMHYIEINKTLMINSNSDEHFGYTAFAHIFLKRIEVAFTSKFYQSLFCPLFAKSTGGNHFVILIQKFFLSLLLVFNCVLNLILCFFPMIHFLLTPFKTLLSREESWCEKHRNFSLLYVAVVLNLLVYWGTIVSVVSFFLQVVIFNIFVVLPLYDSSFKFWAISIAGIYYLYTFYKDFVDLYKLLLDRCFELCGADDENQKLLSVKAFGVIVEKVYPLRTQIFTLIVKILVFSIFLYVIIDITIIRGFATDAFIKGRLPVIIGIIAPVLALKVYAKSPKQHMEKHGVLIKDIIGKNSNYSDSPDKLVDKQCSLYDLVSDIYALDTKLGYVGACLCVIPVIVGSLLQAVFAILMPCCCHSINPSCKCVLSKDDLGIECEPEHIMDIEQEPLIEQGSNQPLNPNYHSIQNV